MGQEKSSLNQMQTADGRNRTWMQMVPANRHDAPRARPLVVMLHGAGGSAGRVIGATRWDEVAEREGFVVACPNGTPSNESKRESFLRNPQTWNSGQGTSLAADKLSAHAKAIDDVGFIAALIEKMASVTPIDRRRIFVAGHSNGAAMAFRFARERPELVAAVGVMAGHLGEGLYSLASPVSLIAISGDQDPFAPLEGGVAGTRRFKMMTRPARLNSSDWARANGLPEQPHSIQDDERVVVTQWGPDGNGTEVRWVVVRNHGHSWAGGKAKIQLPDFLVGPKSEQIDATCEMWAFFESHPKLQ